MTTTRFVASLGTVVFAAGLMASPVLAKCPKECRKHILLESRACKALVKAETLKCRNATNPTPPGCSPSGAFLD